ncbi:MAG: winged helix-turn-helix transcriptional regulator [Ruminococcaceae bacterium]|nr:winged helix-turn-helix transcriptional regulator [Oscillospiraceae bacterium]
MEERFEILSRMVWGVHGNVQKLKVQIAEELGIKGAHVFLIYLLRNYPKGLTAAELCDMNSSTSGLISRETSELLRLGVITADKESDRRRYGCKYLLTEKGWEMARRISDFAVEVQHFVSDDIPKEELAVFYRTFGTLLDNFDKYTGQKHLVDFTTQNKEK